MPFPGAAKQAVACHSYPILFATISGAHLYGFASPDSDYDLRGVHILPPAEVMGLFAPRETMQESGMREGIDLDFVTHDVRKFMGMLLKRNGYVLEQLYSPLVVQAMPEHEELKTIARGCITRRHAHHYLGFAETQWSLFLKEEPKRVKPLLYVYRVLLTGIHLMETGEVEANILRLNERFRLPYVPDLVERKVSAREQAALTGADLSFHQKEYERLLRALEDAAAASQLPDAPRAKAELSALLLRLRGI